jgi:hypothetical protein
MLRKAMLGVVVGVVIVVAALLLYGDFRWNSGTRELRDRLEAARIPIGPRVFDNGELERLPAPVQRYFRAVLQDGQPIVAAVDVEHTGTFDLGKTAEQWKPFTSTQRVITRRPGFDWDARVAIVPGLSVRVHDAYVAGEGILRAALLGLVPLVYLRGTGEVAQGELMRFFAEAAWYPTALLPSQGVHWEAVDDHAARATLKDGALTLALLFRFSEDGLIALVRADARGRTVGGTVVPTPWQGRFWNYAIRDGMQVPLEGEVAWLLPEGAKPYWRGHIIKLSYEFAR